MDPQVADMDPQVADYLSNLEADTDLFLQAFLRLKTRFQEAADRGIDDLVAAHAIEYQGDLSHMTDAKLAAAFTEFQSVDTTMLANGRAVYVAFYGIIR